jgi:hypothetical protein
MKQGWLQTLGGLAILVVLPLVTVLCLSPDVHDWVRTSIIGLLREQDSSPQKAGDNASQQMKNYRLPDAISKIAQISEAEPDFSQSASAPSSGFSRAVFRLQRALRAYPDRNTKNVFRAVNGGENSVKTAPCPFERINGEQSVVLAKGDGGASLTETLNRCAAAVEQINGRKR